MKLDRHIAYRFLTDSTFWIEMVQCSFPQFKNIDEILKLNKDDVQFQQVADLYRGLDNTKNKSYYITESVTDKLDMLKVSKDKEFPTRHNTERSIDIGDSLIIDGNIKTFDWTVFANNKLLHTDGASRKFTYIMPDNQLVRLITSNGYLAFTHITCKNADWKKNYGDVSWCMFWFDTRRGFACTHWRHPDVQNVEEYIFKLLCFIYLSENEESIIPAGGKHGTKKSGKVVNSLPVPITIVTSKWNVTSIRTEGFDVSGHFRLQPTREGTKMIFIQPFRKHGYTRRAKSLEE